jgi:hypothetical protein
VIEANEWCLMARLHACMNVIPVLWNKFDKIVHHGVDKSLHL